MTFVRNPAADTARRDLQAVALGALLAVGLCGSAMAQTPPPANQGTQTQSGQPPKKKEPGERIICVNEETIGTRLGTHRVCHTKSEWDQISRDSGDLVNDMAARQAGSTGK